ncbi:MAG: urea amidolyase associated protein UAAP1 [Acidimicrobiia bacterium]
MDPDPPRATTGTSTTAAARDHARAQATVQAAFRPTVPAADASDVVDHHGTTIDAARMLADDRIGPGGDTSMVLPRGGVVRLTDVDGDACANVLVYRADQPSERLNVADTVKVQWQAYLGAGSLLLSDMGRVLMSVVADTCGAHDALCGASTLVRNEARYGTGSVHGEHPNARDRFAVALAKHGLDRRDIVPNVNFFKSVVVEPDGSLRFVGDASHAGAYVELRAELPVLVVVANTPHVLDPRDTYSVTPLRVSAWSDAATDRSDPAWSATPEGERAFLQTEESLLGTASRSDSGGAS